MNEEIDLLGTYSMRDLAIHGNTVISCQNFAYKGRKCHNKTHTNKYVSQDKLNELMREVNNNPLKINFITEAFKKELEKRLGKKVIFSLYPSADVFTVDCIKIELAGDNVC